MALFCFDIDGTLRNNTEFAVQESTIRALNALKDAGHRICISTGRSFGSMSRLEVYDMVTWDGFVCNNGQSVFDGASNVIEWNVFDPEIVLETIRIADAHDTPVMLKKEHRIITREPNEYVYDSHAYLNNPIPPVGTYNGKDDVLAMMIYAPKGYDYAEYLHIKGLHVAPMPSSYADASIEGVSKASGCLRVAKMYGLKGYIAFGDSQNDLDMFKGSDYAVCMGNGTPEARAAADYITSDVDHDGIANAVKAHGWTKKGELL